MLKSQGITRIKADGFLTRRYGYYNGIINEEQRNEIQYNTVDKFLRLFLRLAEQFEGISIDAYPFDVDSYIHLNMNDNISSKNQLLNELFMTGANYSKEEPLIKKLSK